MLNEKYIHGFREASADVSPRDLFPVVCGFELDDFFVIRLVNGEFLPEKRSLGQVPILHEDRGGEAVFPVFFFMDLESDRLGVRYIGLRLSRDKGGKQEQA